MSPLTFNLTFAGLMGGAFLTAFFTPARAADPVRNTAVALFAPVAMPARVLGDWSANRFGATEPDDPQSPNERRDARAVYRQNAELLVLVQSLTAQLDELKKLNSDRQQLGDLRRLCEPATVIGADAGGRQSLAVSTTSLPRGIDDAPVITALGLVGRIVDGAGVGAARVKLITDRTSRVTGHVERWTTVGEQIQRQPIPLRTPPLVEGAGPGKLTVQLPDYDARLISVGDVLLLDDPAWPQPLRGLRVGRVTKVEARRSAPGFYDVSAEPMTDLLRLRDVQVMVRGR